MKRLHTHEEIFFGGGGGGLGVCAIFHISSLFPVCSKHSPSHWNKNAHITFFLKFTMIPASTLMEPTKHQGKRNLKIKTATHFAPFNPLELKYYQTAGPSTSNLECPLFPERLSPWILPYV